MMLVVGWWESDMPAKHTQKIRAMDSGVLLTAYNHSLRLYALKLQQLESSAHRAGMAPNKTPKP
jgi:hypothetical protein